jgi:hypothetical protein
VGALHPDCPELVRVEAQEREGRRGYRGGLDGGGIELALDVWPLTTMSTCRSPAFMPPSIVKAKQCEGIPLFWSPPPETVRARLAVLTLQSERRASGDDSQVAF